MAEAASHRVIALDLTQIGGSPLTDADLTALVEAHASSDEAEADSPVQLVDWSISSGKGGAAKGAVSLLVNGQAVEAMADLKDPRAVPYLVDIMHKQPDMQLCVIAALASMRATDAAGEVAELLPLVSAPAWLAPEGVLVLEREREGFRFVFGYEEALGYAIGNEFSDHETEQFVFASGT